MNGLRISGRTWVAALVVVVCVLAGGSAQSATLYYGGTGTWNNTDAVWYTNITRVGTAFAWNDVTYGQDIAVFTGDVVTVTLIGTVNANEIDIRAPANNYAWAFVGGTVNLTGAAIVDNKVLNNYVSGNLGGGDVTFKTSGGIFIVGGNSAVQPNFTYTGRTIIGSGGCRLGTQSGNIWDNIFPTGTIVSVDNTLTINRGRQTWAGMTGAGQLNQSNYASQELLLSGALAASGTQTWTGVWQASGSGRTSTLTKDGTYVQVLAGAGANALAAGADARLQVLGGTLTLAKTGGAVAFAGTNILVGTSAVGVGAGMLRLGGSNQIVATASMILTGGVFNLDGYGATLSNLTVAANSKIDFGTSGAAVLTCASNAWMAGILAITNWNGNWSSGGGTNQLRVVAAPDGNMLSHVNFAGYANGAIAVSFGSYYEILPAGTLDHPYVSNGDVTSVNASAALISGFLTSTGKASSSVILYWGTNDGGTVAANWTNATAFPGAQAVGPVSTNISGLSADTVYYYRYCATSLYGSGWATGTSVFITGNITVQPTDSQASEWGGGTNTGTFTVYRPVWSTNVALNVAYTVGGTATAGLDFSNLTGSVVIPVGATGAVVTVYPIPDVVSPEGQETVILTLTGSGITGAQSSATVTIDDAVWYVAPGGSDANSGTSWGQAWATLSNAVAHSATGDTVVVSNGTYSITQEILIDKAITVRSLSGAAATEVVGPGAGNCRVFRVTHPGAVLDGFTVRGGYLPSANYGAGVNLTAGTVRNCTIRNNRNVTAAGWGQGQGGGVWLSGGTVENCLIMSNDVYSATHDWGRGGGAYLAGSSAILRKCTVTLNTVDSVRQSGGGGVYIESTGGTVENCLITRNQARGDTSNVYRRDGGAGVRMNGGTLRNCTIADNIGTNHAGCGVRQTAGTIVNSIIVNNVGSSVNYAGIAGGIANSCCPDLRTGAGNVTANPVFVDRANANYQLDFGSPCIDAGSTAAGAADDLLGAVRPQSVYGMATTDMGCYEALPATSGVLRCCFTVNPAKGANSVTATFTAQVGGAPAVTNIVNYSWDLGNGETPSGSVVANATPYGPGAYNVSLSVNNGSTIATFVRTAAVQVAAATAYVATNGAHQFPYNTWSKAATNVQAALDAAHMACDAGVVAPLVLVSNGTYGIDWQLELQRGVVLRSVSGYSNAVVRRVNCNTRVLAITDPNALVDGFTLRDGDLRGYDVPGNTPQGGGVYMTGGTVSNCLVHTCMLRGGDNGWESQGNGIWMNSGLVANSIVSNNTELLDQSYSNPAGGGIYMTGGTVRRSIITRNSFSAVTGDYRQRGAGVYMNGGNLETCMVSYNDAANAGGQWVPWHPNGGGGIRVDNGTVEGCLIIGNRFNGAGGQNGGGGASVLNGKLINCTVVGNQCTQSGQVGGGVSLRNENGNGSVSDGAVNGIVQNCIIFGNSVSNGVAGTNIYVSGVGSPVVNYDCAPELASGVGNTAGDPKLRVMGSGFGLSHVPGNYRLASDSPGINKGTNQNVTVAIDLDGEPRVYGRAVDMGAYEWTPPPGTIFIVR